MSVRTLLARLLSAEKADVFVECRQCGMNVSSDTEECPECGSDEIGYYRIPT